MSAVLNFKPNNEVFELQENININLIKEDKQNNEEKSNGFLSRKGLVISTINAISGLEGKDKPSSINEAMYIFVSSIGDTLNNSRKSEDYDGEFMGFYEDFINISNDKVHVFTGLCLQELSGKSGYTLSINVAEKLSEICNRVSQTCDESIKTMIEKRKEETSNNS